MKQFSLLRPPAFRQALLGLTSASLLFTTTLTPLAAQISGAPPGATAGQVSNVYSLEELEAVLAPIALYPDQLLTQVLMASAFPDQVAAAASWVRSGGNRALRGEALDRALRQVAWDPAVKSLVPFPQVLDMLASHPEWMAQLAFAVSEQEAATFDAVQRLRRQAWQAGQLRSNSQQVVRMDGDLIIIEPAAANVVYVPVYNPQVVYGAWPYPSYPPYYFPPTYYVPGGALAAGIYFGAGVLVAGALWGWATPRWHDRHFYVDHGRYEYFRNFHRPPPGDWRDWDRDRWQPPRRPGDGQFRPPPRPGDGQFRPPPRPGDGQFHPPSRPGDGQVRPPPPRPGDGQVRPLPPRSGEGQVQPSPPRPDDGQFRRMPPRSGDGQPPPRSDGGQFRAQPRPGDGQAAPPPRSDGGQFRSQPRQDGGERFRAPSGGGGDGVSRGTPPSDGRRGQDRQPREN